jgi:hypothetical protein
VLETVVGQTLEGVMRWAWHQPNEAADSTRGPVHLTFSEERGLSVDTRTDWTLWWLETRDTSALDRTHNYVMPDGGQWRARDASSEVPFASLVGARLLDAHPVFNAVAEAAGLALRFETGTVILWTDDARGEVVVTQ